MQGGCAEPVRIPAALNALFEHGSPYHGDGLGAARPQASTVCTVSSARPRRAIGPNRPSFGVRVHVHRDTRLTGGRFPSERSAPSFRAVSFRRYGRPRRTRFQSLRAVHRRRVSGIGPDSRSCAAGLSPFHPDPPPHHISRIRIAGGNRHLRPAGRAGRRRTLPAPSAPLPVGESGPGAPPGHRAECRGEGAGTREMERMSGTASIFDQGASLVPDLYHRAGGAAHSSSHRRSAVARRAEPPGAALRLPLRLPRPRLGPARPRGALPPMGVGRGRTPCALVRRRARPSSAS